MALYLIALLAAAASTPGSSGTYRIAPGGDSLFSLQVAKTGLLSGKKHLFIFEDYSGTVEFDPETPGRSRVEFSVAAASVVCKDTWVSAKDLKKIERVALQDMMQAETHPRLTFVSTAVVPKSAGEYDVIGNLTVRGILKPVTVAVRVSAGASESLRLAGRAEVKLRDYGIKPPGAALGTIGTKNEMQIEFRFVASRY